MMPLPNQRLKSFLNMPTEMLGIRHIDAAIHKPKAVRGADNRINI